MFKYQSFKEIHKVLGFPDCVNDSFREGFSIVEVKKADNEDQARFPVICPDYFFIMLVKEGEGFHIMDGKRYPLKPNTIYFVGLNVPREFEYGSIVHAHNIIFTEQFLKKYIKKEIYADFPFLLAESIHPPSNTDAFFEKIENICHQIYKELDDDAATNYHIIGHYIAVLLHRIKEYHWSNYDPIEEGNKTSKIIKSFKGMLDQHYIDLIGGKTSKVLMVKDYAKAHNFHPNYFSSIIKIKTGKSVAEWIAEKTFTEAKVLLEKDMTIKEISYSLGFYESSHFGHFFKKHAGISPSKYRKIKMQK